MNYIWKVATLAAWTLVESASEQDAREHGQKIINNFYRKHLGRNIVSRAISVRQATSAEITSWYHPTPEEKCSIVSSVG